QPGPHEVAHVVERQLLLQLLDVLRLLRSRSDAGEVSSKDVDDLWQLVAVARTEHSAERRDARIVLAGPLVGQTVRARAHRSELEDPEALSVLPDAVLPVEQRSAVRDQVAQRDEGDGEGERDEADERHAEIQDPLHTS